MSDTEVSIEPTDLDTPTDDDGDGDNETSVYVAIYVPGGGGMRYSGTVHTDSDVTPQQLAEMVASAVRGAVTAHSRDLPRYLTVNAHERWDS